MHRFQVWAPGASRIQVQAGERSYPMTRTADGWWEAAVESAGYGTDYAFCVDAGKAVPDPRSGYQPYGVHGPSRLVDPEFAWTDSRWNAPPLSSAVIYEMHVGTFAPGGTFDTAIAKLDALADLGITHVEMMPIAEFPGNRGWGYDGVDLFAPYHCYGGPDAVKRFVNACHERGLAVLLDVVYNHFGPSGNYLAQFGPYTADKYRTPWGEAVNLDGRSSREVRRFFVENALMWLRDYHFDGLRLDAIHALIDNGACHFLEELADAIHGLEAELGRHLVLIAESDLNDPRIVRSPDTGGYGIDAQWSDDFHHALHTVLTGEHEGYYRDFGGIGRLAKALRQGFVYDGGYSVFRERPHGRSPAGLPGHRFVVAIQNHDQIGNRARGERISHLTGLRRARMAAALVMTSPFVPLIFQGEEWAASTPFLYFTDHQEPHLAAAVTEGRRAEFAHFSWNSDDVPDPQDPATFEASRLRWEEREWADHRDMLAWYRSLIRLRRSTPDLLANDLRHVEVRFSDEGQWLVMHRGRIAVACNFGSEACAVPLPGIERVLLATGEEIRYPADGLELAPESVAIVQTASRAQDCPAPRDLAAVV